jgi:DNA-binding GntR family transcriptional regulator
MLETGYPPALSVSFNRTLSEQVAAQLRQAILNGELKPGRHIVERDIAEAMRLSRGPRARYAQTARE